MSLLILQSEQKTFFDDNGYLLLKGFYNPEETQEMRRQFHELVTDTDSQPKDVKYAFMDAPECVKLVAWIRTTAYYFYG